MLSVPNHANEAAAETFSEADYGRGAWLRSARVDEVVRSTAHESSSPNMMTIRLSVRMAVGKILGTIIVYWKPSLQVITSRCRIS